jgi:hypothetical protein
MVVITQNGGKVDAVGDDATADTGGNQDDFLVDDSDSMSMSSDSMSMSMSMGTSSYGAEETVDNDKPSNEDMEVPEDVATVNDEPADVEKEVDEEGDSDEATDDDIFTFLVKISKRKRQQKEGRR